MFVNPCSASLAENVMVWVVEPIRLVRCYVTSPLVMKPCQCPATAIFVLTLGVIVSVSNVSPSLRCHTLSLLMDVVLVIRHQHDVSACRAVVVAVERTGTAAQIPADQFVDYVSHRVVLYQR
jgi:hypothetical protein